MRWQGSQYFGQIVRITDSGFVISDAKAKERIIDIDQKTAIRRGRQPQGGGLQVGERVIVVGKIGAGGHVHASLIRIVEDGPRRFEK